MVLPDLPLHGDSEDRPRHPYTPDWLAEVIAGFCREVAGARPLLAGHDIGAEIALRAIVDRPAGAGAAGAAAQPAAPTRRVRRQARRVAHRLPGRRAARVRSGCWLAARRSCSGRRWASACPRSATRPPATCVRHAFADVAGNGNRARSWAKFARRWPAEPQRQLLDAYPRIDAPVLLLWADEDPAHPVIGAYEALDLLPTPSCEPCRRPGS